MSSLSPTDLDLVRGLHARDPKALARVYGDYHAAVYNLCARILGDREEAKDVTQDVFLKAFGRPPAASGDVRLRPWLFRVATNACFNLIRARRGGGPIEVEALAAGVDRYEQARTAALIESTLAGMNERYRAALVLKDLHGLDGRELAEVLQVSRPTADVLVHRARAAFRRVFAGLAGDDAVAPANLAVALPALAVPAALQALPLPAASHAPLPAGAAPGPAPGGTAGLGPLAAASGAGTAAASGAGPAAGLLAKIGAAVGTKAAVIAAGAAVVAGGGVAAVKLAGNEQAARPGATGGSPGFVADHASGSHPGAAHSGSDAWRHHRRLAAAHAAAHHAETTLHGAEVHGSGHGSDGSGTHAARGGQDHDTGVSGDSAHGTATEPAASGSTPAGDHGGESTGHDEGGEH